MAMELDVDLGSIEALLPDIDTNILKANFVLFVNYFI
jgi:hypothetical protein